LGALTAVPAAADPTVTTLQPENVTNSQATLAGSFAGDATGWSCGFFYRQNYFYATGFTYVGATSCSSHFTSTVGVSSGYTYEYYAVATKESQTLNGSAVSFSPPPQVTTGSAQNVTDTTATLAGSAPTGADACWFEYGTSSAYGSKVDATSCDSASAAVSGLTINTKYHYRFVARYASGTSFGDESTFSTGHLITGPASAVTDIAATVSGSSPPDTFSFCSFEYGPTTDYGSYRSVSDCDSPSEQLTGLTPGTVYHYRFEGSKGYSGSTVYGDDKTFTTKPRWAVTGPPTYVADDSAGVTGSSSGTFVSCEFEYGPTTAYGSYEYVFSGDCAHAEATIDFLSRGTTCHYRFVAHPESGDDVVGQDRTFTTTYPTCAPPEFGAGDGDEQLSFYSPSAVFIQRRAAFGLYRNEGAYYSAKVVPGSIRVRFAPSRPGGKLTYAFGAGRDKEIAPLRWPLRFAQGDGPARVTVTYLEDFPYDGRCRRTFRRTVSPLAAGVVPKIHAQRWYVDDADYSPSGNDPYAHHELEAGIPRGRCEAMTLGKITATIRGGGESHSFALSDPCGAWNTASYRASDYKLAFTSGFGRDATLNLTPSVKYQKLKKEYTLTFRRAGKTLFAARFRVTWDGARERHIDQAEDDFVNICKNDHRTVYKNNGRLYCLDPQHSYRWIKPLSGKINTASPVEVKR
jgi:hypothetical protein